MTRNVRRGVMSGGWLRHERVPSKSKDAHHMHNRVTMPQINPIIDKSMVIFLIRLDYGEYYKYIQHQA